MRSAHRYLHITADTDWHSGSSRGLSPTRLRMARAASNCCSISRPYRGRRQGTLLRPGTRLVLLPCGP
jgi:hypothetical protein